jgi:5-methylcytosine-specific restriction enzyme A
MPLLYYWRRDNYRRDLDMGAGYHLNQPNALMHEIDLGDSLWAFTRTTQGRYVLAAELVVRAKTYNPPNFRYGRYRLWGDLKRSRYFMVEEQPSVDQVIRSLSVKAQAAVLGSSFQGHAAVRRINQHDHVILNAAAQDLPPEPRARILPEEKLEAALLLGDKDAVYKLVQEEQPGIAEDREQYLYRQAPSRNRQLVQQLQDKYEGKCQICAWNPRSVYDESLCHGHHIQWLSRGGDDDIENMMLVCPNHHEAIHRCDSPFDFRDMAFDFISHREILMIDRHLRVA